MFCLSRNTCIPQEPGYSQDWSESLGGFLKLDLVFQEPFDIVLALLSLKGLSIVPDELIKVTEVASAEVELSHISEIRVVCLLILFCLILLLEIKIKSSSSAWESALCAWVDSLGPLQDYQQLEINCKLMKISSISNAVYGNTEAKGEHCVCPKVVGLHAQCFSYFCVVWKKKNHIQEPVALTWM